MKRNTILALGLITATAIGSALATAAFAHGDNQGNWRSGNRGHGGPAMMDGMGAQGMGGHGMIQRMHGQGTGGPGFMGGKGHFGGQGMGGALFKSFDADNDGTVTPEEAEAGLKAQLETYDTDDNGTLSLKEFEALHNTAIRPMTVDRFQMLDEDGDGQVTAEEITAPAKFMGRMHKWRSGQPNPGAGNGPRQGQGQGMGPGNGPMMNDQ